MLRATIIGFLIAGCGAKSDVASSSGDSDGSGDGTSSTGTSGETSTETTTETSDSTSSGQDTDAGSSDPQQGQIFLPPYDHGPPISTCQFDWPLSCDEGQKCTAYATVDAFWDANKCVPIVGDGEVGDECTVVDNDIAGGNDDCAKGFFCWGIDPDTMLGTCVEVCPEDPGACQGDTHCALLNDGDPAAVFAAL